MGSSIVDLNIKQTGTADLDTGVYSPESVVPHKTKSNNDFQADIGHRLTHQVFI